ncbi:hypothetical protein [Anatilimnocola floriformis]|uniref:hypothetical protein n=1 Tax=Anatilimnocola floriformis TaxID=2948575 RepID=UPI0020C561DA|nr:hypothetical protein [Anatilimnocola floriformis]
MRLQLGRTAFLGMTLVLAGTGVVGVQAQGNRFGPPPEPKPLTAAQKDQIEVWRKQFPYVSLAERLKYEDAHREDAAKKLEPPAKPDESSDKQAQKKKSELSLRAQSLEMLHSNQVERFIANQGLGFRRMMAPAPEYLQSGPPVQSIPFDKLPPLSAEEAALKPTSFLLGEKAPADAADPAMLKLMPTRSEVANFHRGAQYWFLPVWGFGHVKSRDEVAGFLPHAFTEGPKMSVDSYRLPQFAPPGSDPPQDPNRWKIARLELVSLLKQAEPRVYESKHLPRMDELRDAPTRPLTKFESASLAKLQEGGELPTSSTTNRIEFVGAIRAGQNCLQCHEVREGTMLGAFSYELRREPPLTVE